MLAVMRTFGIAAVLLAACGGPHTGPAKVEVVSGAPDAAPSGPVEEPTYGYDWSKATWATDDEAMALWTAIGINGDNYQILLGEIPRAPGAAMAKALLRQGNFACASTTLPMSCEETTQEFLAVAPDATIDDPCLRRRLALWALDSLDDKTLTTELIADVIALAGLPPPEDELNRTALYRVQDEAAKLQMLDAAKRAGNEELADETLGGMSTSALENAAAMHIDGAVLSLTGESTSALAAATEDKLLRSETRARAAFELGNWVLDVDPMDPSRQVALDAVVRASRSEDCVVAGSALQQLTQITGKPAISGPPKNAKEPALIHYMCQVMWGGDDEWTMWDQVTDERGVVVRHVVHDTDRVAALWEDYPDAPDANKDGAPDVDEADADGDGDPATVVEIRHFQQQEWKEGPYLDDIRRVLPDCKGTTCSLAGSKTTYTFKFRKAKKKLVLDAIEIDETTGACDAPAPGDDE